MAGSNEDIAGGSVTIKLTADDNIKDIRKRTITLTEADASGFLIGRASKVTTKGYVAAADNAWFDSPVMSRKHAEIFAEFGDKEPSVCIRDTGSLHGTFLNGDKEKIDVDTPVELQDGCKIIFGVPIMRNSESFTPTTIRVGIVHNPGTDRSGPVPGTFALPESLDDDLSSSEEETEEMDKGPVVPPSVVDLTKGGPDVEMVDLTSPPREASPDVQVYEEMEDGDEEEDEEEEDNENEEEEENEDEDEDMSDEGIEEPNSRVGASVLCNLAADGSNKAASGVGSSPAEDAIAEPESAVGSEVESDFTDSELTDGDDIAVKGKASDSGSGSDSDGENSQHGWAYDSGDNVLDPDDPDTSEFRRTDERLVKQALSADHGPHVPFNAFNSKYGYEGADVLPAEHPAHFNHPSAFSGPYEVPYYPMSDNATMFEHRPTLPAPYAHQARAASPSDAALPIPRRSVAAMHMLDSSYMSTQGLGDKTGKHAYFAARSDNKRAFFAPSRYSRPEALEDIEYSAWPTMGEETSHAVVEKATVLEPAAVAPQPADVETSASDASENVVAGETSTKGPTHHVEAREVPEKAVGKPVEKVADKAVDKPVEKLSNAEKDNGEEVAKPAQPAPASISNSVGTNQTTFTSPLLQSGDKFLNDASSSVNLQLPTAPSDGLDESISASDLKERKIAAMKRRKAHMEEIRHRIYDCKTKSVLAEPGDNAMSGGTQECGRNGRRTHVGISDLVDASPMPAAEAKKQPQAPAVANGKRKADEMEVAELTEPKKEWQAANIKLMRHVRAANDALLYAPLDEAILARSGEPHGRTADTTDSVRAPKRIRLRKIAERLGYAALGGATVGAALVSTLIYTAPTFT